MKIYFDKDSVTVKVVTWITVGIFFTQNISWAAPAATPNYELARLNYETKPSIFIPQQYGKIETDARYPIPDTRKPPTVILVKDAHCNYEAQTNISKILDTLIRDYKIKLVGVEGASGFVNPGILLESNPSKDLVKKVTDQYMRTGLLTGAEVLSANKGKEPGFTIWGIEDLKLYLKDLRAFRDTLGINQDGKHFTALMDEVISRLKEKTFNENLKKLDKTVKTYESNEIPLTKFIKILYKNYGIPYAYKNLKYVLKSIRLEEKINFTKVEKERNALIRELEKHLPKEDMQQLIKQSLLYRLGKIPAFEYYTYLENHELQITNFKSNLNRYIRLIKLQNKINETEAFNELEGLTEKIYIDLCINKTSSGLHQLDKNVNILNKILSLEATRENLSYFKNNQAIFAPEQLLELVKVQAPLNNIAIPPELNDSSFLENVKNNISPAEEFYQIAIERDNVLVENLLQTMDKNKEDKAALICGGFHAEGIKNILQNKGINPITITPSITKEQPDSRELYLARMMDKRIDPEKLSQELGITNLQAPLATGKSGIEEGLPQIIIEALELKGIRNVTTKEEFRKEIKRIAKFHGTVNSAFDSFIESAVDSYNASLPEGEEKIVLDLNNLKIFNGEFIDFIRITQQNLVFRIGKYVEDNAELQKLGHAVSALLELKRKIKSGEITTDESYPRNCETCTTIAGAFLTKAMRGSKIYIKTTVTLRKEEPNGVYAHSFIVIEIGDKEFIIDLAADQFEKTEGRENEYADLGVVIIPMKVVTADPKRFWMYTSAISTITTPPPAPAGPTRPAIGKSRPAGFTTGQKLITITIAFFIGIVIFLFLSLFLNPKQSAFAQGGKTTPVESAATQTAPVVRISKDKSGFYWDINGIRKASILGINYSPVQDGKHPNDYNGINGKENYHELYKALLPKEEGGEDHAKQLSKMGVETIKIYGLGIRNTDDIGKIKELFRWLYDTYKIRVIITDFCGLYKHPNDWTKNESEFLELVKTYGNEPWVLAFTLGNENNYYLQSDNRLGYHGSLIALTPQEYYSQMSKIASKAKEHMGKNPKPIGIGNGNFNDEQLNALASNSNGFDFIGINNYDNKNGIADALIRIKSRIPNLPVFFTEYGILEAVQPAHEPELQRRTRAIYNNRAGHRNRNSIGGCLFEATDNTWKAQDTGQPWQSHLGILGKGINPFKIKKIQHKGHTLKAPGSSGLDEDAGAKEYIEDIVNNPDNISETIRKGDVSIHVLKNEGELKNQLGIPRFYGAIVPQDLIYAYGKNIDGKLHIYVTGAFWEELQENPVMLAFIIDHEYQENILGKTHAEVSQRAWNNEFLDEFGMNVFYKFYIGRLAEEEDIDTLVRFFQEPHPNDPQGVFKKYVLETLTLKIPKKLQEEMEKAINDENLAVRRERIKNIKADLRKIHDVLRNLITENGTASSLVYEKLENILYDILRKGNTDANVNLTCISLPMALLNPLGYDVANKVKKKFYEKVEQYMREKPYKRDDRGVRFAYDELSGHYYGFAQARLYVIGISDDEFDKVKEMFMEVLEDPEVGIQDAENFPVFAGHTLVTLENNPIVVNFNSAKKLAAEGKAGAAKDAYRAVTVTVREMVVDAMKEVTGRAEAAEKSKTARERLTYGGILGETDKRGWLSEKNNKTRNVRSAIFRGRYKTIPENEYAEPGKIPRLGHAIDYLAKLLSRINEEEQNRNKIRESYNAYFRHLNQSILKAFQDKRYSQSYKKAYADTIITAWRDGTLADYTEWLKEKGMRALAEEWEAPLKMTKMGDEIWLYFEVDGKIQQIFVELDKFNAFNEQYPADVRDSIYHQILDFIFNEYARLQREGSFTAETFAEKISTAINTAPIIIPVDIIYAGMEGFTPKTRPAKIIWYSKDGKENITLVPAKVLRDKPIRSGNTIPLGELRFQYTEKARGRRLPLYVAAKNGKASRKVVVYERRIFTADGKKDITDDLMQNGWELSPYIGTVKATVTIDTHSLTNLSPYTISKLNTWQKKNRAAKILDAPEITVLQIMQILASGGISLSDVDKENLKTALRDALINAYNGKTEIDFMQLWELLMTKTNMPPEKFFVIAADISSPLNALLGYKARSKGAQILNALLKEILEKLPAAKKKEISEDKRVTNEEKLLGAFKKAAAARGIDPNCARNVFDLLNMGIEILKADKNADFGKIDSNYFELIDQIAYITNLDSGTVRKAIFGREVPRSTSGEIKPDSVLVPVIQRLRFCQELSGREKRGNLALDLDVPGGLFSLDAQRGEVTNINGNEDVQYLSALDAVNGDLGESNKSLQNLLPVKENQTVFISIPAKMFITYMRMDETQKRIEIRHNPGLKAFLDLMERAKTANIKIGLRASDAERGLLEKIITLSGLKNVVVQNDIANTREALALRKNICDTYTDIVPANVVFITPDGFTANESDIKQGLKIFGAANGSALHALLLFGTFYALTDNVIENGRISDAVIQALRAMGVDEEQINEIKQGGLFFTVKLIRIADTLREFQNRKITIDTAA